MLVNKEVELHYLDLSKLEVGQQYSKVAYLLNYKTGLTQLEEGFYTFYLKDCNANVTVARLFNVEQFIESGLKVMALAHKPVRINFIAQSYAGSISLVLTDIELYEGDFDYDLFIGKLADAKQSLLFVSKVLSKLKGNEIMLPSNYADVPVSRIAGGRCGGYASLLRMATQRLLSYEKLPGINLSVLFSVFNAVQDRYFNYLRKLDTIDVLNKAQKMQEVQSCYNKYSGDDNLSIIVDTFTAIIGLGKAEHLYANLICNAIKDSIRDMDTIYTYNVMVLGATKEVGDLLLVKY